MIQVKSIAENYQWAGDEMKIALVVLAISIGIAIPSVINRGLWVRFVPDEFIGWFMQAVAVAVYAVLFLHYLLVSGE